MDIDKYVPGIDDDTLENDESTNNATSNRDEPENLTYNAELDSYEIDVKSDDPDYEHDDPYTTAVKDGGDSMSTYDESNPLAVDEYIPNESLETDVDSLAMHVDHGRSVNTDIVDQMLAHTAEDDRDDLDEEGYPKNDAPKR